MLTKHSVKATKSTTKVMLQKQFMPFADLSVFSWRNHFQLRLLEESFRNTCLCDISPPNFNTNFILFCIEPVWTSSSPDWFSCFDLENMRMCVRTDIKNTFLEKFIFDFFKRRVFKKEIEEVFLRITFMALNNLFMQRYFYFWFASNKEFALIVIY